MLELVLGTLILFTVSRQHEGASSCYTPAPEIKRCDKNQKRNYLSFKVVTRQGCNQEQTPVQLKGSQLWTEREM